MGRKGGNGGKLRNGPVRSVLPFPPFQPVPP